MNKITTRKGASAELYEIHKELMELNEKVDKLNKPTIYVRMCPKCKTIIHIISDNPKAKINENKPIDMGTHFNCGLCHCSWRTYFEALTCKHGEHL